jgi:hypothetical protein
MRAGSPIAQRWRQRVTYLFVFKLSASRGGVRPLEPGPGGPSHADVRSLARACVRPAPLASEPARCLNRFRSSPPCFFLACCRPPRVARRRPSERRRTTEDRRSSFNEVERGFFRGDWRRAALRPSKERQQYWPPRPHRGSPPAARGTRPFGRLLIGLHVIGPAGLPPAGLRGDFSSLLLGACPLALCEADANGVPRLVHSGWRRVGLGPAASSRGRQARHRRGFAVPHCRAISVGADADVLTDSPTWGWASCSPRMCATRSEHQRHERRESIHRRAASALTRGVTRAAPA